jgi:hypothetical protein
MKPVLLGFWTAWAALAQGPLAGRFAEQYAQPQPAWVGYIMPVVPDHAHNCDYWQGGEGSTRPAAPPGPVHLEPPDQLQALFRIDQSRVSKIRVIAGDCTLDSGGLPLRWLRDVRPDESIAFLSALARQADRLGGEAITAIALHADDAADTALEQFASASQPESLREKAVFWLGAARGRRGYELLRRIVTQDASDHIRDKAVFALSISKEPQAVETMIRVAHYDASAHVRGQALFWLAQKAGRQATSAIADAIEQDPDTEVKKKAVFALQQLPGGEGVPLLIQVARTNKNPAVRKQAMFWLGQSNDPRALAFFEEILKP